MGETWYQLNLKVLPGTLSDELDQIYQWMQDDGCDQFKWFQYPEHFGGNENPNEYYMLVQDYINWHAEEEPDMEALSAEFPSVMFTLEGHDSDDDVRFHIYAYGGKSETVMAVITYPPSTIFPRENDKTFEVTD